MRARGAGRTARTTPRRRRAHGARIPCPYIEARPGAHRRSSSRATTRVTYTTVAAGVDASGCAGATARPRSRCATSGASATSDDGDVDGDTMSGVARGGARAVADGVDARGRRHGRAHAGRGQRLGLARRGRRTGTSTSSQIYAGLRRAVGAARWTATSRSRAITGSAIRESRGRPNAVVAAPGAQPVDVFDEEHHPRSPTPVPGCAPRTHALPVGVGARRRATSSRTSPISTSASSTRTCAPT